MQMQDLSFKLKNKEIKYADLDISIELFTVENQYTFLQIVFGVEQKKLMDKQF